MRKLVDLKFLTPKEKLTPEQKDLIAKEARRCCLDFLGEGKQGHKILRVSKFIAENNELKRSAKDVIDNLFVQAKAKGMNIDVDILKDNGEPKRITLELVAKK